MSQLLNEVPPEIRGLVLEVYTPKGAEIWLGARNKMLGGAAAIDLIRNGQSAQVAAILDTLSSGDFA